MQTVQAEQVLQAFFALSAKIDSVWSMYIVVNLGVLWFIFLSQRPFLFLERLMAFAGYTVFMYANANSLIDSYQMLQAMRLDIISSLRTQVQTMPEIFKAIAEIDYEWSRSHLILMSHGVTWAVMVLFLGFRNWMIAYHRRAFPEHAAAPAAND
jgi:hypothetical protein